MTEFNYCKNCYDNLMPLINEQSKQINDLNSYNEDLRLEVQQLQAKYELLKFFRKNVQDTLQKKYAQMDRITKRYGDMHKHCKDLLEEICKELGVEIND